MRLIQRGLAFGEIDDAPSISGAELLEHDRDLDAVRRRPTVKDIGCR
jgi:hypothetical protein